MGKKEPKPEIKASNTLGFFTFFLFIFLMSDNFTYIFTPFFIQFMLCASMALHVLPDAVIFMESLNDRVEWNKRNRENKNDNCRRKGTNRRASQETDKGN